MIAASWHPASLPIWWYLRVIKTPEGAANSTYVHFLFGLIFKYEATTEQGHRSQGPNDTARPRRRGDRMINPILPVTLKCSQMADYLPPMAPVSTNTLSWLGESDYALARYRVFLMHARKPSSHDQRLPRHGVWPTCGPNCAAYTAHSFPGTLGLFCRDSSSPTPYEQCKALIS